MISQLKVSSFRPHCSLVKWRERMWRQFLCCGEKNNFVPSTLTVSQTDIKSERKESSV